MAAKTRLKGNVQIALRASNGKKKKEKTQATSNIENAKVKDGE